MTDHNKNDIQLLAEAVVKIGGSAKLLDSENKTTGEWVSISEAVESGRAFIVEPKHTLAVFDLDAGEYGFNGDELESLDKGFVADNGFRPLWVDSGRNTHLYVWSAEGAESVYSEARKAGIPSGTFRRQGVRPPLSPHRNGLQVSLRGTSISEALEILGPVELPRPLPDWFERTLEEGDYSGRFNGNRSYTVLAIASAMKSNGMKLADYEAAMLSPANRAGEKFRELDDAGKDVLGEIRRVWGNAEISEPGFDAEHLKRVRALVEAHTWPGRTGSSQRSVMVALCSLALSYGTSTPTFGTRRLAIASGLSKPTTIKALTALVEAGWISKVPSGDSRQADGYRLLGVSKLDHLLTPPLLAGGKVSELNQGMETISGEIVVQHPAFRNGLGLGKSCGLVWGILNDAPMTQKEVAAASGRAKSTVSKSLKRLEAYGLAARSGDGWVRTGTLVDLDSVAAETGALYRAEVEAQRFQEERESWAGDRESSSFDDRRRREDEAL